MEEAAPDWGPTLNLRTSPRPWSSSFAPTYDLQRTSSSDQGATSVVLKEGPGETPECDSGERDAAKAATSQRGRGRASSEPVGGSGLGVECLQGGGGSGFGVES